MPLVLVVEDHAVVRELFEGALSRAGYETASAGNGLEALRSIEQRLPDLILLDLTMPVMDGIATLQALRKKPKTENIPVILLTGLAEKSKIIDAARFGVKGYMLKSSSSVKMLLAQIEQALTRSPAGVLSSRSVAFESNAPPSSATVSPAPAKSTSKPPITSAAKQYSAPDSRPDDTGAIASIRPLVTKAAMIDAIDRGGELKGFSPAVAEVLKLTGNDRCSIEQVAKAISRDHAIALKILKLANSAVYTRGEPIDSVLKAVLRIGLGQIRQVVLNIAVVERYSGGGIEGFVESGQFWEHAIATGIIAAEIAHSRSEKEADGAFTMGLLHDVGRMVFIAQLGDTYRTVLQTARDLQLPLEQVERRMLCFNHADGMDRVFRAWKFSKEFINPIVFHHLTAGNIRKAAPQEMVQIATLALANRLAHAFMLGSSGNQTIYPTEDLCELLRLDPSVIARIEKMARNETDNVKFALLANSKQANWPQLREVHRQSVSRPLRPLYVSGSPAIDAHRIFCEQMASSEDGAAANLGVISFRQMRERVPLTAQYKAKETELGLSNLPLLIISPAGNIMPENSLMAGRNVECITTPLTIGRFVSTVNRLMAKSGEKVRTAKKAAA